MQMTCARASFRARIKRHIMPAARTESMKKLVLAIICILASVQSAQAAWLLWKHSAVTRRVEGNPRGLSPEGNIDKWDLLNAIDQRRECLTLLKVEQRKALDSLTAAFPHEPVGQSVVADGISATVSVGAEKTSGALPRATQLFYEYTFWCLPAGVDPKLTRSPR